MSEDTIQYLVLDRCDPTCNMARYYVLSIEPSLFGDATLIREWGRIGRPGQRRVQLYENQSGAIEALSAHRLEQLVKGCGNAALRSVL